MTESESIIIGLIFSVAAILCITAYVPCLIAIFKDKDLLSQSCYKMMFVLGWFEVVACCVHLYVGIGTMTGFFHEMPLKWNKLGGAFMEFFGWHYYTTSCAVLSFNRCLHICVPHIGRIVFSPKTTICWIIGCMLYAGTWFVLFNSPYGGFIYDPEVFAWHFDGQIGNITIKEIGFIQNLVNFTPTCICYLIVFIAIVSQRAKFSASGSALLSKREKLLFVQLAIACIYPIVFDQYWHYLHYQIAGALGIRDTYANAFANLLWITVNGLNPFLYLTLNETIRKKVWSMGCSRLKPKVTSVAPASQPRAAG